MKTIRCLYRPLLAMAFLMLGCLVWPGVGLGQENEAKAPGVPTRTERIDMAGEKVGQSLDHMSAAASTHMGTWINKPVFNGISWLKLLLSMVLIFLVLAAERIVNWMLKHKLEGIPVVEGKVSWPRLLLKSLAKPLSLVIWVYGVYAALSPLYPHFQTPDGQNLVLSVAKWVVDIGGTVALFWFLYQLSALIDVRLIRWASGTSNAIDDMLAPLVGKTLRIFIIMVGILLVLQNLTGIQIGALLASLGIGGLAVAFAARDSIANFFGTLTILFDKPFQVGERVVIDKYDGMVENVGFRSTRIRLLNGHLVSIPNEKVVSSSMENIGRRPSIRWLTNIGITYDTPPEKAMEAVRIIRSILDNHEGMKTDFPPRVHLNGFNDWSLNITVIVWYHPPNYWDFQEWVQNTCLEIMRQFKAAGIDFAFPSRTLYLANDDKRQIQLRLLKGNATIEQDQQEGL
jgi:MscS family membrane protein